MRTLHVAEGVAWRVLHNVFTNPSLLIPSLIFPLFFFTAFAGGLSRIDQHRLVKAAVKERFDDGTIHALSVKTEVGG